MQKNFPSTLQYCLANKNSGQRCGRFTPKTARFKDSLCSAVFLCRAFPQDNSAPPWLWKALLLMKALASCAKSICEASGPPAGHREALNHLTPCQGDKD